MLCSYKLYKSTMICYSLCFNAIVKSQAKCTSIGIDNRQLSVLYRDRSCIVFFGIDFADSHEFLSNL